MKMLDGKTAIIYGGGGGIGSGVAETFAREGARVFLAGRTRQTLEAAAKAITAAGGSADVDVLDAHDEQAVEEHVRSVIGYDDCIRGSFDAIAIIDVLYKIPITQWDTMLGRIAARLTPGGVLLVKEHDPTARIKHGWNRLQERAASALGLTLGSSFSYESPADFRDRLQRHGFREVNTQRIDGGYPHSHVLYVARI